MNKGFKMARLVLPKTLIENKHACCARYYAYNDSRYYLEASSEHCYSVYIFENRAARTEYFKTHKPYHKKGHSFYGGSTRYESFKAMSRKDAIDALSSQHLYAKDYVMPQNEDGTWKQEIYKDHLVYNVADLGEGKKEYHRIEHTED